MTMKLSSQFTNVSLYPLLLAPTIIAAFHHPFRLHSGPIRCNQFYCNLIGYAPISALMATDRSSFPEPLAPVSSSMKLDKPTNQHKPSPLAGVPIGPVLASHYKPSPNDDGGSNQNHNIQPILVRYIYEGGHPAQGRLCHLFPNSNVITVSQLICTLIQDGVDMDKFYACAYETVSSEGGWMPLERGRRWESPFDIEGDWTDADSDSGLIFPLESLDNDAHVKAAASNRIDVKLFRRPRAPDQNDVSVIDTFEENPFTAVLSNQQQSHHSVEHSLDALQAIQSAIPAGKVSIQGYCGIGIIQPKISSNIGTLLRSAYQLGASLVYTIGGRYKPNSTDTLNVPARIPLIEVNDWNAFVESSPRSAVWVVIEMGGVPLSEFQHPRNAIYILGSEDHGVPKNVLRACREVVSLEAETYSSYNVAVAGSIVLYDRMIKMRRSVGRDASDSRGDSDGG
jgi:tRNA(Leu) C34 or U34 (ribose-2'-O)-methylase TrmL